MKKLLLSWMRHRNSIGGKYEWLIDTMEIEICSHISLNGALDEEYDEMEYWKKLYLSFRNWWKTPILKFRWEKKAKAQTVQHQREIKALK